MTASYQQLNSKIWMLIAGMASLVILSFLPLGMMVDLRSNPMLIQIAIGYFFVACLFCAARREGTIAQTLVVMGQLFIVTLLAFFLTYAASACIFPYRDAELNAIDLWVGFDRVAAYHFLQSHPLLQQTVHEAYHSIRWQSWLLPLILASAGKIEMTQKYVLAFGLSLIVTSLVAVFVPAVNANIYVDLAARGLVEPPADMHSYLPTLEALRNGSLRSIRLTGLQGLISFPSFHTTSAILFAWAAWRLRLLRWVFVPLNLLMVMGTPIDGGHYLIDLVGGTIVALGIVIIVNRMSEHPLMTGEANRKVLSGALA